MERHFYSITQFAKEIIDDATAVDNTVNQINFFIDFNSINQNAEYETFYTRPIAIKVTGYDASTESRDICINISKALYKQMKKYNEKNPDAFLCIRTDTTSPKIFSSIDGEHEYYVSKVLSVNPDTKLYKQLAEMVEADKEKYDNTIEEI